MVLLAFSQSEYPTLESSMTAEVCVEMVVAPAGGLECDISVTLGLQDGLKAGKCKETINKLLVVMRLRAEASTRVAPPNRIFK